MLFKSGRMSMRSSAFKRALRFSTGLSLCLALAACGDNEEAEKKDIDYSTFDTAAVQSLMDAGNYPMAIKIIREQEVLGIADLEDYQQAIQIYLLLLDGVAAEVAIEKARAAGADEVKTGAQLGKAYVIQGKFKEAEAELEKHIFEGDDAFDVILLRGDIAREQGAFDKARAFFEAAIDDKPENFRGYLGLSLLELGMGHFKEAQEAAALAATYSGDDPIVAYAQGAAARYLLEFDTAKAFLEKAISLQEDSIPSRIELAAIYIEQANFEEAQKQLDAVYALSPEHQMARVYSALILASQGDFEKAEGMLLRADQMLRRFPPAMRAYGHVAFRLGKTLTAQPYLERFLQLVPEDRLTRLALAETYSRAGNPNKALETLEPLLGADSVDLEAHLQAAAAAGQKGDVTAANDWLVRAKALNGNDSEADQTLLRTLGRRVALSRYMNGDLTKAVEQLQEMYSEDEGDFTSLTLMANLQMEGGDIEGAEKTVLKIMKLEPEKAISHNLMGAIHYRQKRMDEALASYNKAIEYEPDYASALKNRALVFLIKTDFKKALPDLEKAFAQMPSDPHLHGMLGRTYLELGQAKKAITHLQQAESAFPRSPIILADHAEALAALGYIASAITKANTAKEYGAGNSGLQDYLDGKIAEWVMVEEEKKKLKAEEAEAVKAAVTEKQAKKAKEEAERKKAEEEQAKLDKEAADKEPAKASEAEEKKDIKAEDKPESEPAEATDPATR